MAALRNKEARSARAHHRSGARPCVEKCPSPPCAPIQTICGLFGGGGALLPPRCKRSFPRCLGLGPRPSLPRLSRDRFHYLVVGPCRQGVGPCLPRL
ncbi:hypothetical protein GOP47_0001387 [Adiantum capillus-veneris]|uniref:Uncharacterized protein n=1 Tax=Adiantum capillus-veneris TaxID=13818 RepID=A0A9D4V898_ADICA|nr:hypothetical protein GOP47_0001387 [Adiantum capillus-veneris]